MLVVDRVELVALKEPDEVGNSRVATPSGASSVRIPATKSLRSGTWARTLLPITRSARRSSRTNCPASSSPKNSVRVGTCFATAAAATFRAGSILERWDSPLDEVLQQVAVVTRQLDDEALEPSPSRSVISSVYRLACSTQLFE